MTTPKDAAQFIEEVNQGLVPLGRHRLDDEVYMLMALFADEQNAALCAQLADAEETLNTSRQFWESQPAFDSNRFRLAADAEYRRVVQCLARIQEGR